MCGHRQRRPHGGVLTKETLCGGSGGILHLIHTGHGEDAVIHFVSDLQRVIYAWLGSQGMTMGLRDCTVTRGTKAKIKEATDAVNALVADITQEMEAVRGP